MFRHVVAILLLAYAATALAAPFSSRHVLVVEDDTGTILIEKNAHETVPIASLTKLMTAMVILDVNPDMDEAINIGNPDVATKKRNSSRVPLGASLPRKTVLQLALMSSDNRAAASLARAYPGGEAAFKAAVQDKLIMLEMDHTTIDEPTGLSSNNRATAFDVLKMVEAAAMYPEIVRYTTDSKDIVEIRGRPEEYRNTNKLVGQKGWDILLSKTGFTSPAGRCLIMRMQTTGHIVTVVLLNAKEKSARTRDVQIVRNFLEGDRHGLSLADTSVRARPSGRQYMRIAATNYPPVTQH